MAVPAASSATTMRAARTGRVTRPARGWAADESDARHSSSAACSSDRGRVAPGRILLEAARDDGVERGRDTCANLRERRRLVVQHRRHDREGGVPLEGAMARKHFVEDRAERKHVRARVHVPAFGLLRRHVGRRPHDDADRSGRRGGLRWHERLGVGGRVQQLREAEVEHLHLAAAVHQDVRGLHVAMDDAGGVRGGERAAGLDGVVEHLRDRDLALRRSPRRGRGRPRTPSR